MNDPKDFLYGWCTQRKAVPQYKIESLGTVHSPKFFCELTVDGFPYTGSGHSTSKKHAQTIAAQEFVSFLIRQRELNALDIPTSVLKPSDKEHANNDVSINTSKTCTHQGRSAHQLFGDREEESYQNVRNRVKNEESIIKNNEILGGRPLKDTRSNFGRFPRTMAANSSSSKVPDNNKLYAVEMAFYEKKMKRRVYAMGHDSNKEVALRHCANSLVKQLYRLGVTEASSGTLSIKKVDSAPENNRHLLENIREGFNIKNCILVILLMYILCNVVIPDRSLSSDNKMCFSD